MKSEIVSSIDFKGSSESILKGKNTNDDREKPYENEEKSDDGYRMKHENISTTPSYKNYMPFILDGLQVYKINNHSRRTKPQRKILSKEVITEKYLELTKILSYESQEEEEENDPDQTDEEKTKLRSFETHAEYHKKPNRLRKNGETNHQTGTNAYRKRSGRVQPNIRKILEREIPIEINETVEEDESFENDSKLMIKDTTSPSISESKSGKYYYLFPKLGD